jgi:hypothetical protein
MREIPVLESVRKGELKLEETRYSMAVYRAYVIARTAGNEHLDFNDIIWDQDIQELVAMWRELELEFVTLSNSSSGMVDTLAYLEKLGCKLLGLTKVRGQYPDIITGQHAIIPAFLVEVN